MVIVLQKDKKQKISTLNLKVSTYSNLLLFLMRIPTKVIFPLPSPPIPPAPPAYKTSVFKKDKRDHKEAKNCNSPVFLKFVDSLPHRLINCS